MPSDTQILNCILTELQKLNEGLNFGNNFVRITPFRLGPDTNNVNNARKILERDPNGRVRKVSVWVDAASGGPTPTIRLGTSDIGSGGQSGGIRVNAGQANPIGEYPGNAELWAAASTNINIYVFEVG